MFNKVQYYFVTMLCLSFLLSACKKEQVVGGISNRKAELGKKIFFDIKKRTITIINFFVL